MDKKMILGIIIGGIIFGSVGVYAGTKFYASDVSVDSPAGSNLGSNATLQDSLDELYSIADKYDELNKKINALENNTLTLDKIYPVGSIFFSTDITIPSDVSKKLGGTWVAYGASDTYLRLGGNGSGGANSVTLQANQIPTHTTGTQSANHTHSIPSLSGTAASAGSHTHKMNINRGLNPQGLSGGGTSGYLWGESDSKSTASAGAHTHSVTTKASTTGANSTNHTHTYTNSNQQSVSITPKYVQVYAFKRTA